MKTSRCRRRNPLRTLKYAISGWREGMINSDCARRFYCDCEKYSLGLNAPVTAVDATKWEKWKGRNNCIFSFLVTLCRNLINIPCTLRFCWLTRAKRFWSPSRAKWKFGTLLLANRKLNFLGRLLVTVLEPAALLSFYHNLLSCHALQFYLFFNI